jgi:hypothetical protein
MRPKIFSKNKEKLLPEIEKWMSSEQPYTVRFGIEMLMIHFLGDSFDIDFPQRVAKISSDMYYVRMMQAWYFATALAHQYEQILPFIENNVLDEWTHNKAIQKAVESYRVTAEQKEYLKGLRIINKLIY